MEDAPRLRPPRKLGRLAPPRLRVLSLTGGGYRGLFTAAVLARLVELGKPRRGLNESFDVFAGTSIGGLLACALAVGIPAEQVRMTLARHGPKVFPSKVGAATRRFVSGALYDSKALGAAVDECLGRWADKPMRNVPVGLVISAINWVTGRTQVFTSRPLGASMASSASLRDVCLATAAAPTYFEPHLIDKTPMIDGGLVANNPDALVVFEAARRWSDALDRMEVLSIGTAGVGSGAMAATVPKAGREWAGSIVPFIISAQERLACDQVAGLLGTRYLRINHEPGAGQQALSEMDRVDASMTTTLQALGKQAAEDAFRAHRARLDRLMR